MPDAKQRCRVQELHDTAVALGTTCAHQDHHSARENRLGRAAVDDPVHPGWPGGAPDDQGGEFRPKKPGFLSLDEIPSDSPKRPVRAVDSNGRPILVDGKPILRPADLPPELFVQRGLAFRPTWVQTKDFPPELLGPELLHEMFPFVHGRALDAQRIDGLFVREYRDYATIAIGLHDAAAGISLEDSLANQNDFAGYFSRFDEPMDPVYTHLPVRNVRNTKIGYELYRAGRVTDVQP